MVCFPSCSTRRTTKQQRLFCDDKNNLCVSVLSHNKLSYHKQKQNHSIKQTVSPRNRFYLESFHSIPCFSSYHHHTRPPPITNQTSTRSTSQCQRQRVIKLPEHVHPTVCHCCFAANQSSHILSNALCNPIPRYSISGSQPSPRRQDNHDYDEEHLGSIYSE